ncbi:MAG: PotD/PotF family extracellular solute-binding protein, partial [Hyphomicrobiaceae bacterium]
TLRVQRRNPPALVATMDLSYAIQALEEDLVEPVSIDLVPNLADVVPQAPALDGKRVSYILSTDTLVYNTNKWSAPPASYADIFTPERLPTTGIGSPSTNVGIEFLAASSAAGSGKPISEAMSELKGGIEYLARFRDDIRFIYGRAQEVMPLLAAGDVNSCFVKARFLAEWINRVAPVQAVIPQEGAFYSLNCLGPVKGVAAPELAMAFIDIMLSPEIQKHFPSAIGSAAVNTKTEADIPESFASIVPTLDDIEKLSLLPVLDQSEMEELNTLFNQLVAK